MYVRVHLTSVVSLRACLLAKICRLCAKCVWMFVSFGLPQIHVDDFLVSYR